jgi:hypothetical protein
MITTALHSDASGKPLAEIRELQEIVNGALERVHVAPGCDTRVGGCIGPQLLYAVQRFVEQIAYAESERRQDVQRVIATGKASDLDTAWFAVDGEARLAVGMRWALRHRLGCAFSVALAVVAEPL